MNIIKDNIPTSMWKVRELMDKATNVVMNYTETEAKGKAFFFNLKFSRNLNKIKTSKKTKIKVREATNDDPWGPSGTQMNDIARMTFM